MNIQKCWRVESGGRFTMEMLLNWFNWEKVAETVLGRYRFFPRMRPDPVFTESERPLRMNAITENQK